MKRKLLALILAMLMLLCTIASCAPADDDAGKEDTDKEENKDDKKEEEKENTGDDLVIDKTEEVDDTRTTGQAEKLVIAVSADPNDLTPWNVNNGSKGYIYPTFYEFLFDLDTTTGEYIPVIAESYTVSDDGLSWDVKIREGVVDHAGNTINADDVLYAYDIQFGGGYVVKSTMFESIEKVDDMTVRFNWNKVIDGVCEVEWPVGRVAIFDQESYETYNFATEPKGTGPYKVTAFTAGSSVTVEKNENYWWDTAVGGERVKGHNANVDTIEFQVMAETAQHVIALENDDIDLSYAVPKEYLADFVDAEGYSVYKNPASNVYGIMPNFTSQFGGDVNFRLALYYAVDTAAVAEATGSYGHATAICSPLFADYYNEWKDLDNYMNTFDPTLAKEYLDKTDYAGETLVFLIDNGETTKNAAQLILALWQAIGISAELDVCDGVTWGTRLNENDWDVTIGSYGGGTLIGGWNRLFNVGDFADGKSFGHNGDDTLHAMYKETALIKNMSLETMTALHNYIVENAYFCAYGHANSTFVYSDNVVAQLGFYTNGSTVSWGDCTYYVD